MNTSHLKYRSLLSITGCFLFFLIAPTHADGVTAKGPDHAAITIIVYSDSQCPSCVKADKVLDEVIKAYPDDIQVVRKSHSAEISEAKGYGVTTAPTFFING
ncbi:MAG: thioredoxin domain-containing protein, partial [Nitrospirae bacterium]|nr:thioredoxin domain-containing protein [Candidatus Troglogloeales bacterium]